ncbi:hypothetical protein L2Y96_02100 [Luteibacter aegosomaticola]|uniref:hypothetical protein n=1 Tax=Luteibacter aegosomaticola TaxID=2911538 RepID=UPI001FF87958|nr:hypothetical protein [Luteibacter aegosomaticola]UPG90586.1 hypothetical protein L2Y96_02100 [Luteibacter aegosomaticola]
MMRSLIRLIRPDYPFTALERLILDAVVQATCDATQQRLRTQIAVINRVQRLAKGKEVDLYCMRRGRAQFPDALLFPLLGELDLADVHFVVDGGSQPNSARVSMVDGQLFSMVFSRPPGGTSRFAKYLRVIKVNLWRDPSEIEPEIALTAEASAKTVAFDGSPANPPGNIPSSIWKAWNSELNSGRIDAALPDDYLQVLSAWTGSGGLIIYDPRHIRLVACDEANYYVLAEKEGRSGFAVIQGGNMPRLFRLDYEAGTSTEVGRSLAAVIL